ncbi:MAG: MotA/TolQ/ExbB proton channel [Bacteriovoracaceae bacterium]|nr:MotA/TolQ/ExbB proton channel [Bacteriovoracaceae bacterium]
MGQIGLLDRFHQGGTFMYPILIVGIISALIILDRLYVLYLATTFNKTQILTEVRNAIYSGRLVVMGQTLIHQIIQTGFQAFERSHKDSEVQLAIDAAASKYFPIVEKRTGYLSMLANIATLLGLLGTISGLIVSFAGAATADPAEKATKLASGISEAMNCTAFGLTVAIPTLLCYAFLQGRTQKIIDDVNEVVLESMNFVITHREKLKSGKGEA